ncbi:acyl-CoA dehydrogenase family protein [Myxococcota bacterium]|nr:acyl-CoA dehydrogenase family protein [Myxococcota bacterium]
MDLRYSKSDEEFRAELRAWLEVEVPKHGTEPEQNDWESRLEYDTSWQRKLFEAGFAGINWPVEYGGRDASLSEQLIYYEEYARSKAPYVGVNFVGLLHGGPTLMAEGTEAQKEKHIPRIIRGEEIWCQGFSEPTAGSDLASLRTRAERDGDEYVINGHKIWTSFAQVSDYCELLARTDPDTKKHAGISWLILPMDVPGIEIRPLPTLKGELDFSEVFFEDVRIPVDSLVGKENDGWRVTNVTLRFERGTAFASEMYKLQEILARLKKTLQATTRWEATAWDDAALRREVGHLQAELDSLWAMLKLAISETSKTGMPGLGASAMKLYYTDLAQRVTQLCVGAIGRAALSRSPLEGLPDADFLGADLQPLSLSIAGGSSQIQRNIIAERILGHPKER